MRYLQRWSSVLLLVVMVFCARNAPAQEARPFEDVKPDHWSYKAVTDLHNKGYIVGYPDGHFDGRRTLTRYEFAVALKRTFDAMGGPGAARVSEPVTGTARTIESLGSDAIADPSRTTASDVDELRRLAATFNDELISLGVNMKAVTGLLDKLEKSVGSIAAPADRSSHYNGEFAIGINRTRLGVGLMESVRSNDPQGGFALRSRFGGGASATVFGGPIDSAGGITPWQTPTTTSIGAMDPRFSAALLGSGQRTGNGFRPLNFAARKPAGALGIPGQANGRLFGLHGDIPILNIGEVGITYLNYSPNDSGSEFRPASSEALGGTTLYGANVRLNPIGRFVLSGEANKTIAQRSAADTDPRNSDATNAFLVNLNYNGGPVRGAAGYQYYDPRFSSPANWNTLGGRYNPTNVQGPFARVAGRFDNLQADLGVDFLTAARNRPGSGGFTPGSSVVRGVAGLGYRISKQFEITANYEGVLYDMSGAVSASGIRAKPVEQYLTLGAGLNLSGNTVLRLAYQIVNVQDYGNGFGIAPGFGGSSPGGQATSSVITTQFAIHF